MLQHGMPIFSPIVHCHKIAQDYKLPTDFEFWQRYNFACIKQCTQFWILTLPGFDTSVGVAGEIEFAVANQIPIHYVEPIEENLND